MRRAGGRARPRRAEPRKVPVRATPPAAGIVIGVAAALVVATYAPDLGLGFSNDDFTILDKVRGRTLGGLLGARELLAGWWRPWSRELHFALLDRAFHGSSLAFHAANLLLWLGVVALGYVLLRRLLGPSLAVPPLAGALAASSWGLFVLWACASQDLWMLLFSLAFLVAFDAGRLLWSALFLAGALLSKETAIVLVPLAIWLRRWREGGAWPGRAALATIGLVVAGWGVLHPSLGGRLLFGSHASIVPVPTRPFAWSDLTWFAAPFNLEFDPGLAAGLPGRAVLGAAWAIGLGALAAWGLRAAPAPAGAARRRLAVLGLGWWAIAWTPMLAPFLRWHSYYGWIGLPGLWLAITAGLAGRGPWLVLAIAVTAYLRPFAAHRLVDDWGTEEYQREAATNLVRLRDALWAHLPTLPPHARVFLGALPNGIGFHTGVRQSMPLRVWYRDSTVQGCLFSEYAPRPSGDRGPDFFFVATPDLRLLPVADGTGPAPDSLRAEPLWAAAEEHVAHAYTLAGEYAKARDGFARLAATFPSDPRQAFHLGEAWDDLGDHRLGAEWRNRADSLVGSPPRLGAAYLDRESRGGR